ncbi:MAG: serine/threonine protein kinase [Planctomycetota bacterium]|jgi:serine/threonine protein kinase
MGARVSVHWMPTTMTQDDPLTPPLLRKTAAQRAKEAIPDEQLWSWVDRDAPELALHLETHPEDRGRVDELRRAIRAVAGTERDDRAPERIGPYPIKGKLGSGGMGVVFEAVQVRTNRRVAIKVIRGAWLDDERTRRLFFREAEVLGRLQHTGIAAIHDAGETKDGSPYFVMELIDGKPLDDWAEGQSLDTKLDVATQIAEAVHHAHEKGIIHRDLKPSNVLVTAMDEAKVLDFGLARITDPGNNASLTAAMSGNVIGTVRYMSPEQARGLASKVTPSSDVYSIGVLLYELVTGRLPHDFEGADLFECARRVAEDKIAAPSRWAPNLSGDLDRVIQRALAKDPGARYVSAEALAADLRRVREGLPVEARSEALDLGQLIGRWGVELGCAAHRVTEHVTRAASEVFHTKEGRHLREQAQHVSHRVKEAGTETSKKLGGKFSQWNKDWRGRARWIKAKKNEGGGKTIHFDLNPVMDAAGIARKGAGVAATAGLGTARFFGRGLRGFLRALRPWLWRALFLSLVIAAVGLVIAVQVEYDGNWSMLFSEVAQELRGVLYEIKKELT